MAHLMSFRVAVIASLLPWGLASNVAWPNEDKPEVFERIPGARLNRILKSLELDFSESVLDKDTMVIKDKDVILFFLMNREEEIAARVGFPTVPVSIHRLNEWNRERSGATAYFDRGGSLWLSSTHQTKGGVTEKNVKNWLKEFLSELERFKKHIARDEGAELDEKVTVGPIAETIPTLVAIVHLSDKLGVILKWDSDAFDKAGMSKVLQAPCGGLAAQKDVPLRDVLDKLLGPLGVTYQAERDRILIVPAKKTEK
jgi:hypothetical protein